MGMRCEAEASSVMHRRRTPLERRQGRSLPFARVIRELRENLGLTASEFSVFVGCSTASLSAWENGESAPGRLASRALKQVAYEAGYFLVLDTGALVCRL